MQTIHYCTLKHKKVCAKTQTFEDIMERLNLFKVTKGSLRDRKETGKP